MNPTERAQTEATTMAMVTHCIGRYQIDIPEQMILTADGGQEIEGLSLNVVPMSEREFNTNLVAKKTELEHLIMPGSEKYSFLRSATPLPGEVNGIVFDRATSEAGTSRMGRVLELMAWKSGYSILSSVDAVDTDFPEFANDAWIKESKTTTAEKRVLLLDLLSRTRGREPHAIPSEKGLCILNGFVAGSATAAESVTFRYQLGEVPGAFLTVNTDSSYVRSEPLAIRGKTAQPMIDHGGGSILRNGKRSVSGVSEGEELLYKMIGELHSDGKQVMTYKFVFEANNRIGSANAPLVTIDFDSGEMKPASETKSPTEIPVATLTEGQAMAIWDAVIPTIGPRRGAF